MEKQAGMSLDEVLSSIKQMVTDKEPPVLELTDMISPDGKVIKITKDANLKNASSSEHHEISDFLRLAQENSCDSKGQLLQDTEKEDVKQVVHQKEESNAKSVPNFEKKSNLDQIIQEIATPLVQDWIKNNLHKIVEKIVQEEIRKRM